ncbi:hypothetical protein HL666_09095 [Bradyrhizobium sp. 83002]|uniref:hypothetical protein n=1 Tax=Bradyrhizobium aeschynomenes TaxID=2734909 RepID=UPI0015565614|nr:hypothetical protein [Bradyrhizobium aeschynomenes]NPU10916.1 hypothetical protein [Bradyrhizobium aeschynomenes]
MNELQRTAIAGLFGIFKLYAANELVDKGDGIAARMAPHSSHSALPRRWASLRWRSFDLDEVARRARCAGSWRRSVYHDLSARRPTDSSAEKGTLIVVRTVKAIALFTVIVLLPFVVAGTLIKFGILSPFQPGTARTLLFGAITIAFTIAASIVADGISPSKPIQPFEATKGLVDRFLLPSEDIYLPAVTLSRSISKGFFDLIRNLAVIGALKYFADKTGNAYLELAVQLCFCVMIVWVYSYLIIWKVRLFGHLTWGGFGDLIDALLTWALSTAAALFIFRTIGSIVDAIVKGQIKV